MIRHILCNRAGAKKARIIIFGRAISAYPIHLMQAAIDHRTRLPSGGAVS